MTHIPAHYPLRSGDAECTQLKVSFIPFTPSSLLPPLDICFPGLLALQSEPVLWSLPLGIRSLLLAKCQKLLILLVISGSDLSVAVNGSWEHIFFYWFRVSQSAKICPCLSASLYLVRSEGSVKIATPLGHLENVAASDSFLHPTERAMCVVGLCPVS